MDAILGGLLGAVLGALLYRLGWYSARRTPRRGETDKVTAPGVTMTPQELYNFLNYDGGEMEVDK